MHTETIGLPRIRPSDDWPEHMRTPAALHRATIAEHQPSRYRPELPRIMKWLIKQHPEKAWALLSYGAWRDEQSVAANDNSTAEDDADGVDVMDMDSGDRTRPSVSEIRHAAPPGTRTIYRRTDAYGRPVLLPPLHQQADPDKRLAITLAPLNDGDSVRADCGEIVLDITPGRDRHPDEGFIVEYGRTAAGRPRRASYRLTGAKGADWPERSVSRVWDYLSLNPPERRPGSLARPFSGAPAICSSVNPLPPGRGRFGVAEGRRLLRDHGVDGEVEFEDARLVARRHAEQVPPAIVSPASCFDGVVHGRDDAPLPLPAPIGDNPRESVTAAEALVIEEALAGGTFADIGRLLGAAPTYASRLGKDAVLRALAADNDNSEIKSAAA